MDSCFLQPIHGVPGAFSVKWSFWFPVVILIWMYSLMFLKTLGLGAQVSLKN